METYNYDESATPGFGPEGSVTPSVPDNGGSNGGMDMPANPGFGPGGSVTPSLPNNGMDMPANPGFGPGGSVTPSLPNNGMDVPAAPGFGPGGSVTPSLPGSGMNNPAAPSFGPIGPVTPVIPGPSGNRPCVNCGINWPNTTVLWTWGNLSPIFSGSGSVSHVRFYNAASSREPLDIYLNNRLVVSNLDFMEYTNYLHILPGFYRLTVFSRTNPGTPIINTNVQFRGGIYYTLSILGSPNNYSVQLLSS